MSWPWPSNGSHSQVQSFAGRIPGPDTAEAQCNTYSGLASQPSTPQPPPPPFHAFPRASFPGYPGYSAVGNRPGFAMPGHYSPFLANPGLAFTMPQMSPQDVPAAVTGAEGSYAMTNATRVPHVHMHQNMAAEHVQETMQATWHPNNLPRPSLDNKDAKFPRAPQPTLQHVELEGMGRNENDLHGDTGGASTHNGTRDPPVRTEGANTRSAKRSRPSKRHSRGGGGRAGRKEVPQSNHEMEVTQAELRKLGATLPGESPEEISAWIAARKANWPSRANVERKRREAEERAERGQLDPCDVSKPARGKRGRSGQGTPAPDLKRPCQEPSGVASKTQSINEMKETNGPLLALAADYASASSGEEDAVKKVPEPTPDDSNCLTGDAGSTTAQEVREKCHRDGRNLDPRSKASRKKGRRSQKKTEAKPVPRKASLLEKLLEPEIRAEHSLLLQSLRLIVKENFFTASGQGPDSSS